MKTILTMSKLVLLRPEIAITSLYLILCFPTQATVIEFGLDGEASVSETKPKSTNSEKQSFASDHNETLRSLTRDVGLRFSGTTGVRSAGLDALTFIEVFEALILAESNFNPTAVSPKGAQGLGQLMPDTAAEMNVSDPFDPKQNLIGSAQYFTQLLGQFGSLDLALAAYNAGPERVKEYAGIPPFKETQNYVAKILKNVGLDTQASTTAPSTIGTTSTSIPINKEQTLKGDRSVWEF